MAIAAGLSDGMGLGLNARAALITRGLAEIARLGTRSAASRKRSWVSPARAISSSQRPATFHATAASASSCARQVARRGVATLGHVAEGVYSAREVARLAAAAASTCR